MVKDLLSRLVEEAVAFGRTSDPQRLEKASEITKLILDEINTPIQVKVIPSPGYFLLCERLKLHKWNKWEECRKYAQDYQQRKCDVCGLVEERRI